MLLLTVPVCSTAAHCRPVRYRGSSISNDSGSSVRLRDVVVICRRTVQNTAPTAVSTAYIRAAYTKVSIRNVVYSCEINLSNCTISTAATCRSAYYSDQHKSAIVLKDQWQCITEQCKW
eukprot:962-Heterococcus_DN1.PRE.3